MDSWNGAERRRASRVNYPCLLKVLANDVRKDEIILTHVENISLTGVCVFLTREFRINIQIELEIDLLDFEPNVKCVGRIARCEKGRKSDQVDAMVYEIGIQFVELEKEGKLRISNVVESLSRKKGRL